MPGAFPICPFSRQRICMQHRRQQVRSLGWEDSLKDKKGNPPQYFYLENSMDRGAWRATVHRVTKSWKRLSDYARM